MNYKILFGTLFMCLVLSTRGVAQEVSKKQTDLIKEVLPNNYKVYHSKEHLNKRLLKFMKKKKHLDFQMVNPNEIFNESDIVVDNFPRKRLILLAESSSRLNFILYESGGGNAPFTYALIYKQQRGGYDYVAIRTGKLYTVDKFKEVLESNQYEIL